MPLRLDIKLSNRSERVKSVDFHPSEPWVLAALYNGNVHIWNHETQVLVKTFEITDLPVRAAKFIARKSWLVAGSDDMQIRVFNYNTHEKVIAFDAHVDYIRTLAVHHTQPFLLTASDDMLIKLWDWEKGWKNVMVFEGHTHYIMHVVFNPKDNNTFASACLDRTVKIWSLGSSTANYTLDGHEKGVNCVDYYYGNDKPYLISGADDKLVKVWDYQNKTCVQTLEGHTQNVTVLCFHPELPIIISGSEDGTIRIWHSNTYRLENTLNYGMERVWAIGYSKGSNDVAFGYDEGIIAIKLGREEPTISMDNSGKIIWARHSAIFTTNVKSTPEDNIKDGDKLVLPSKDLGSCEVYPQTLQHSPNGRFVVVCGDGEYIIYTALAWRNKSFGSALEFVWALDSNEYAIRESTSKVKVFKNGNEKIPISPIKTSFNAEGIFGGSLLGIRSTTFLNFYDWETGNCVRRVDVAAKKVFWSESDLVCISCEESFYVLKFSRTAYQQAIDKRGAQGLGEEGCEEAFDVKSGCWVGDSFIYTNTVNRLNYMVGGQVSTISHFDNYSLPVSVIEYQTAVLRGDLVSAEKILPTVPGDQRNRIARFLESQNLKEEALNVSTDLEHKFDLAVQLEKLEIAYQIASEVNREEKWKIVGDAALKNWNFNLSEDCMKRAVDLEGLLLMYQTSGNRRGLKELSIMSADKGKNNIAFLCHLLLGEIEQCISLLCSTDRIPEAALLARTYLPSEISSVVKLWKDSLTKASKLKMAESLADAKHEELFPDIKYALVAEEVFKRRREKVIPATEYTEWKDSLDWDIIGELKAKFPNGVPADVLPVPTETTAASNTSEGANASNLTNGEANTNEENVPWDGEKFENMSHLSLEVNTTGTGSLRGDVDFDTEELISWENS
ncbi:Coatomer subunit beta' [Clydaea vesicula]|uniref:Coatomer subunit beta' n=1 Tax=Clydaea vesicula TaxID=447962 RepID=A0AAD5Y0M7_9FUNG|nr:Coatomer subunit beta' [Clydaea vesicula]